MIIRLVVTSRAQVCSEGERPCLWQSCQLHTPSFYPCLVCRDRFCSTLLPIVCPKAKRLCVSLIYSSSVSCVPDVCQVLQTGILFCFKGILFCFEVNVERAEDMIKRLKTVIALPEYPSSVSQHPCQVVHKITTGVF